MIFELSMTCWEEVETCTVLGEIHESAEQGTKTHSLLKSRLFLSQFASQRQRFAQKVSEELQCSGLFIKRIHFNTLYNIS